MGLLDVLLLGLILSLGLAGWRSGLIHESATLMGLALGLVVAGTYYDEFGPQFQRWIGNRSLADLAAFVAILFATWAGVVVAGLLLRDALQGMRLGWIDGIGGMALGIAKGLFMAEVVTLVLMAMPGEGMQAAVERSLLGRNLAALAPEVVHLVPAVLRYWKPF